MARLASRPETYFTTVRGMCRRCRQVVPARVFFLDDQVYQHSLCPTCENEPALIAADSRWYLEQVLQAAPDHSPLPGAMPSKLGCPHDCGPCVWHASPCQLPVVSVTNACDLRCPICFTYNRADRIYHMPVEQMRHTVDALVAATGTVDLINVTGGEPTLHPRIIDLLEVCKRPEIGRVTMNSNGLSLAEDPTLCRQLADLGVYVVLSFNTFDRDTSVRLHGRDVVDAKLRAIDNLTAAGANMTLLHVLIRDTNEDAITGIFDLMRANERILSLTVQTMTYTGQGGGSFARNGHMPVDAAARVVAEQSGGAVRFDDFVTRPAAHPLCYLICYLLKSGDRLLPFARWAPRDRIEQLIADSYLVRPGREEAFFTDAINELYAQGRGDDLHVLRNLVERLYPDGPALSNFERQRIAESAVRTVYVHAHMDEDTFDCARAMRCPDLVPTEPGRLVPACTYNLFYRMHDPRFYVEPTRDDTDDDQP